MRMKWNVHSDIVCALFTHKHKTQYLQNNLFVLVLLIYLTPPWETRCIQMPMCIKTHNLCTHSTHPLLDSYTLFTKSCWSHSHKSCINPYSHLTKNVKQFCSFSKLLVLIFRRPTQAPQSDKRLAIGHHSSPIHYCPVKLASFIMLIWCVNISSSV